MRLSHYVIGCLGSVVLLAGCLMPCPRPVMPPKKKPEVEMVKVDRAPLERALIAKHGQAQSDRIRQGLDQVLARWTPEDGDAEALKRFVTQHFLSDEAALEQTFQHLQYAQEMLDGHANETGRELSRFQILDQGPLQPVDALLSSYSPSAHILEDLFKTKVAFVVLLNFPLSTLEQRLNKGPGWSRKQWAQARLTALFEHRVPPPILQEIARTYAAVETYIDTYNVHMDRVLVHGGKPFRSGLKLISHWGLRDEIRGQYAQEKEGLPRQRTIVKIMERIVRQEIPREVVNSGALKWDPEKNLVRDQEEPWRQAPREDDVRYQHLRSVFQAQRQADPSYHGLPTYIDRVFSVQREISEERMRGLLESVLKAPQAREVGALISTRLGRPLEPFDIWYTGFKPKGAADEQTLDKMLRQRYPTIQDFQKDLPQILGKLGFAKDTAGFLADRIVVDPARGAGHAHGSQLRQGKAHLRTRFSSGGMDYKGFNIAIHELGHNVEQVFSISRIDHTLLEGVPNTGFTEAFAFLFQARDLSLLGQSSKDPQVEDLRTLDRFWMTFEIAGVAMLDMEIWRWMYDHPDATPAQLRQAVVRLAGQVWDRYYAPVFGIKGSILPAIYSHIIAFGLYTPDYPLGFLITNQVEQYMKGRDLAVEMERMCRLGRLAPDVWMMQAVGAPVSSKPLLDATKAALQRIK